MVMVIHIPLFNTVVSIGDFLFARRTSVQSNVCLVKGIADCNQVLVKWWLTIDELNIAIPSLPLDKYKNLVKCRVKEVVEDCTTMETINVCNIIDVAFVFHANTLEKEYVNCAGMTGFLHSLSAYKWWIVSNRSLPPSPLFVNFCSKLSLSIVVLYFGG
jgi:hypothetical protein